MLNSGLNCSRKRSRCIGILFPLFLAVDAGASRIDICIETDGHLQKLTVSDDGPGMDMETLENVYFELLDNGRIRLSKIGDVRLKLSRPIEGQIKTCAIVKDVDQWFVVLTCETATVVPTINDKPTIGVDEPDCG